MDIAIVDPFGVADDPDMPFLAGALDPVEVRRQFASCLPQLARESGGLTIRAIRVLRHKPGRRCLIAYDLEGRRPDASARPQTVLGKARAKGLDRSQVPLLEAMRAAGFDGRDDGIAVPEPIGMVPEFQMWLQRQEPGVPATRLLAGPGGVALARRIAEAAHKLHREGPAPSRRHTMADELGILHDRLRRVARSEPKWASRLERLLAACQRLGSSVEERPTCGIHRDFYPDQVLVDGTRLCLLDFDLYCEGNPALDIGNFLGHLTEQSLRSGGDADGLADRERAMEDRFVELRGESVRPAIRAYATLTLARHIAISAQMASRRHVTGPLVDLCERRLGLRSRVRPARVDTTTITDEVTNGGADR